MFSCVTILSSIFHKCRYVQYMPHIYIQYILIMCIHKHSVNNNNTSHNNYKHCHNIKLIVSKHTTLCQKILLDTFTRVTHLLVLSVCLTDSIISTGTCLILSFCTHDITNCAPIELCITLVQIAD